MKRDPVDVLMSGALTNTENARESRHYSGPAAIHTQWAADFVQSVLSGPLTRASVDAARARIAEMVAELSAVGRPKAPPAGSEAQLSALKEDLRMTLDGLPAAAIPNALSAELRSFQAAGNDTAVWLLAGDSGWAARYLRSRGADPAAFDQSAQQVLASGPAAAEIATARALMPMVAGPNGLQGAVTAAAQIVTWNGDAA